MLRDIHELSYQEIADRLGVPEGTVKSRINRGRLELARQIRKAAGVGRRAARAGRHRCGATENGHEPDDRKSR